MKNKKNILVNLFGIALVMLANTAIAQSAYHGGKGDGYASAEIQNVVMGINPGYSTVQSISIFPNPAKTDESLQIIQSAQKPFQLQIINMLGEVVLNQVFSSEKTNIPLSNYKQGSYIIQIRNESNCYTQKLVITNP